MRRRWFLGAMVAAVLATPAGASAWTAPRALGHGIASEVGIDRAGRVLVLWGPGWRATSADAPPLMVGEARAGGATVRSRQVAAHAIESRLAVAPSGHAAVAWLAPEQESCQLFICPGTVHIATRAPGGRFDAPVALARRVGRPAVAIDDRGGVVVAMFQASDRFQEEGRVLVVSRAARGREWRTEIVAPGGDRLGLGVSAALAPRGAAVVVWSRFQVLGPRSVLVASRRSHGGFGAPQQLMADAGYNPTAVLDGAGRGLVAWEAGSPDRRVFSSRRSPAGRWSAPVAFGSGGNLRVSTDPAGGAVAWWDHYPHGQGSGRETLAAHRAPGRPFSTPVRILPGSSGASVGAGPGDRSVVAWMTPPAATPSVWVGEMRGAVPVAPRRRLADRASTPLVAVAPSGAAAVAYSTLPAGGESTVMISTQSP